MVLPQDSAKVTCILFCHFVSLIPIHRGLPATDLWCSNKEFLEVGCGPAWQHAHLLAGLLMHQRIDCYIVCGAGKHGTKRVVVAEFV